MMNWMKRNWFGISLLIVFSAWVAHAQTTGIPWQVTVTGPAAGCALSPVTTPPSATYCFANDTFSVSRNGGPYTALVAGVSSFNGRTGAVLPATGDYTYAEISGTPPTAAVTSVNGKTGAVVLSATTTVQ
jgi:hypothetical protein